MTIDSQSNAELGIATFHRSLGLFDSVMMVVGVMIGSGIFIVSAEMSRQIGSSGGLLAAWLLTGALTVSGALTYGELAAMMPRAGGMYIYLREAFSPLWGFLYGWTLFLVIQTGTIAAVESQVSSYPNARGHPDRHDRSCCHCLRAICGRALAVCFRVELPHCAGAHFHALCGIPFDGAGPGHRRDYPADIHKQSRTRVRAEGTKRFHGCEDWCIAVSHSPRPDARGKFNSHPREFSAHLDGKALNLTC